MTQQQPLADGEERPIVVDGHQYAISWHPPAADPPGLRHGAAGICIADSGEIVLISENGVTWDLPAGRPEGDETWEETFRREMMEEACATVIEARLLGFGRGACLSGPRAGLTLVRSFWRARVSLGPWEPQFEITHRRLVTAREVPALLPPPYLPIALRALAAAGVL